MDGQSAKQLAFFISQTAFFNCRLQAMIAQNQLEIASGNVPVWSGVDFNALEREFDHISYKAVFEHDWD